MRTLKILFVIFVFISPFILHVWKKNIVNAINIRISNLTRDVYNIERNVMMLRSKWRKEAALGSIEKKAKKTLKMRYPEKREILKIEKFKAMKRRNEK